MMQESKIAVEDCYDIGKRDKDAVVWFGFTGIWPSNPCRPDVAAGIVDENINAAEPLADLSDDTIDSLRVRQVPIDRKGLRTGFGSD